MQRDWFTDGHTPYGFPLNCGCRKKVAAIGALMRTTTKRRCIGTAMGGSQWKPTLALLRTLHIGWKDRYRP